MLYNIVTLAIVLTGMAFAGYFYYRSCISLSNSIVNQLTGQRESNY